MALRFLAVYVVFIPAVLFSQESPSLDVRLFREINNRQTEDFGLVEFVNQTSIPLFVSLPAGLLLWGVLGDNRSAFDTGVLTLSAQAVTFGVTTAVKAAVDRPRPFEVLRDVKVKRLSSISGSSFPSGHASHAFAMATMFALRAKPLVYIPALLWAGYVGYARVYVGVHYPSDVLGGIVTGVVLSIAVYQYRDSILKVGDRMFGMEPSSGRVANPLGTIEFITIRVPLR
jgi:undecaprenyl-diphosphatase